MKKQLPYNRELIADFDRRTGYNPRSYDPRNRERVRGLLQSEAYVSHRHLEARSRVHRIADYEQAESLLENGFTSALEIGGISESAFLSRTGAYLERSEARQIHDRARGVQAAVTQIALRLREGHSPWNRVLAHPARRDGIESALAAGPAGVQVSYEELFGVPPATEIPHANSVYGPGAYFVDLLRLIGEKIQLEPAFQNKKISLRERRPDLWNIPVTAANADTEIDYLELLLEILESTLAVFAADDPAEDLGLFATSRQALARNAADLLNAIANPQVDLILIDAASIQIQSAIAIKGTRDLTFRSLTGPANNILVGSGKNSLFDISDANVSFEGLQFTAGEAGSGAAILQQGGSLNLTDCIFTANTATSASGATVTVMAASNRPGSLSVSHCTFIANANSGGGPADIFVAENSFGHIQDSIFWSPMQTSIVTGTDGGASTMEIGTCDLEGGANAVSGTVLFADTNFDLDPALDKTFNPTFQSPCIGRGENGSDVGARAFVIYDQLSRAKYPFDQPFSLPAVESRAYLEQADTNLAGIKMTYQDPPDEWTLSLALAYLDLTFEAGELLFTPITGTTALDDLLPYYGLAKGFPVAHAPLGTLVTAATAGGQDFALFADDFQRWTGLGRGELDALIYQNLSTGEWGKGLARQFFINHNQSPPLTLSPQFLPAGRYLVNFEKTSASGNSTPIPLGGPDSFTVVFRVRITQPSAGILQLGDASSGHIIWSYASGKITVSGLVTKAGSPGQVSFPAAMQQWLQIATVYDAAGPTLGAFVNGELVAAIDAGPAMFGPKGPVYVAQNGGSSPTPAPLGYFCDLAFYDAPLAQQNLVALLQKPDANGPQPKGIFAMNEGTGTTLTDPITKNTIQLSSGQDWQQFAVPAVDIVTAGQDAALFGRTWVRETLLLNVNADRLDRLNRFIRTAGRLGWSYAGLDRVLAAIVPVTSAAEGLAIVQYLSRSLGIDPIEAAAFFGPLNTLGRGTDTAPEDLFDRIYNNPALAAGVIFSPEMSIDLPLNEIATPNALAGRVMAALAVSAEDLYLIARTIAGAAATSIVLDRTVLTQLFRFARLAALLQLSVPEFLDFLKFLGQTALFAAGIQPKFFPALLNAVRWIKREQIDIQELLFLISTPSTTAQPAFDTAYRRRLTNDFNNRLAALIDEIENRIAGDLVHDRSFISEEIDQTESLAKFLKFIQSGWIDGSGRVTGVFLKSIKSGTPLTADQELLLPFFVAQSQAFAGALTGFFGANDVPLATIIEGLDGSQFGLTILVPGGKPGPQIDYLENLYRFVVLARRFALDDAEITLLIDQPGAFFNDSKPLFPAGPLSADEVFVLSTYKSFTGDDADRTAAFLKYLERWAQAKGAYTTPRLAELADLTGQDQARITALAYFTSGPTNNILQTVTIQNRLDLADDTGLNVGLLKRLGLQNFIFDESVARELLSALFAKKGDGSGEVSLPRKTAEALSTDKRETLTRYAIWYLNRRVNPTGTPPVFPIENSRDLFGYLLIDPEMGACARTSRIVQASLSLQLYLQRIEMLLEPGIDQNVFDLSSTYLEWLKSYRLWEVNRKIFLYPENFLEPGRRKDRTPIFEQLEQQLLQSDVTDTVVEQAYRAYLNAFVVQATLEQVGSYFAPGTAVSGIVTDTYYLVGRARTQPNDFYYRTLDLSRPASQSQPGANDVKSWTPWSRIDLTINAEFASPLFIFGRLWLFWAEREPQNAPAGSQGETGASFFNVQLKYSFLDTNGRWIQPQNLTGEITGAPGQQQSQRVYALPIDLGNKDEGILITYAFDRSLVKMFVLRGDLSVQAISRFQPPRGVFEGLAREGDGLDIFSGSFLAAQYTAAPETLGNTTVALSQDDVSQQNAAVIIWGAPNSLAANPPTAYAGGSALAMPVALATADQIIFAAYVKYGHPQITYYDITSGQTQNLYDQPTVPTTGIPSGTLYNNPIDYAIAVGYDSSVPEWKYLVLWGADPKVQGHQGEIHTDYFKDINSPGAMDSTSFFSLQGIYHALTFVYDPHANINYMAYAENTGVLLFNVNSFPKGVGSTKDNSSLPSLAYNPDDQTTYMSVSRNATDIQLYSSADSFASPATIVTGLQNIKSQGLTYIGGMYFSIVLWNDGSNRLTLFRSDNPAANWQPAIDYDYSKLPNPGFNQYAVAITFEAVNAGPSKNLLRLPNAQGLALPVHNQMGAYSFQYENAGYLLRVFDAQGQPISKPVSAALVNGEVQFSASVLDLINVAVFQPERLTSTAAVDVQRILFTGGIDALLTPAVEKTDDFPFQTLKPQMGVNPPDDAVAHRFDLEDAYGAYYRELFYHIPMLVAGKLHAAGKFKEARKWYNYVFNPFIIADSGGTNTMPWWNCIWLQFTPTDLLEELENLSPTALFAYHNDPFDPFANADLRPTAYQKATVMKYIENLIDHGDARFMENTRESIGEAALLYMIAFDLLGQAPEIQAFTAPRPRAFVELQDRFINEFLISLENFNLPAVPGFADYEPNAGILTEKFYFGVPDNPTFLDFWQRVEAGLSKIRNCLSFTGQRQSLSLLAPELDPNQVLRALAGGGSLAAVSADLNAPLPPYRFGVVLEQAKELAGLVTQFGQSLQAALERGDAEQLSALQAAQETAIQKITTEIRKREFLEAEKTIEALKASKAGAEARKKFFAELLKNGLIAGEDLGLTLMQVSLLLSGISTALTTGAAIAYLFPTIFGLAAGGVHPGSAVSSAAQALEQLSGITNQAANMSNLRASYDRRAEEWQQQYEQAHFEIRNIEDQIDAAMIRAQAAEISLALDERRLVQTQEIESFLKSRFTNAELFDWLSGRLAALHRQLYETAVNQARQAERTYQFERSSPETFVTPGGFDALHRGLLAGETLSLDLARMQNAFFTKDTRELEITKTVSLRELNAAAFLELIFTGSCPITLTQDLFDRDYPGHYNRRIQSISITLPALLGPFQDLHATLTQTSNQILMVPDTEAAQYLLGVRGANPEPGLLRVDYRPRQKIAVSHADRDAGLFQLDFNDDRYLPFEGTGAVSSYQFDLPMDTNRLDYNSISDLVLTVNYTARDGGTAFGQGVRGALPDFERLKLLELSREYPDAFYAFQQSTAAQPALAFAIAENQLAPNLPGKEYVLENVFVFLRSTSDFSPAAPFPALSFQSPKVSATPLVNPNFFRGDPKLVEYNAFAPTQPPGTPIFGNWQLTYDPNKSGTGAAGLGEIYLLILYKEK